MTNEEILQIEEATNFDVLNHCDFEMDIIDSFGNDDDVLPIRIYNLGVEEIITKIQAL